jgi:hypothetical protein
MLNRCQPIVLSTGISNGILNLDQATSLKNNLKNSIKKSTFSRTLVIFTIIKQIKLITMYSLDCTYYQKEFSTLDELINTVLLDGMDPNYPILFNGKRTGEILFDFIIE